MKINEYFEKIQKEHRERLEAEKRASIEQSIKNEEWSKKRSQGLVHLHKIARSTIQNGNFVEFKHTDDSLEDAVIIKLKLNLLQDLSKNYNLTFSAFETEEEFRMYLETEGSNTYTDKSYSYDEVMSLSSLEEDFVSLLTKLDESN